MWGIGVFLYVLLGHVTVRSAPSRYGRKLALPFSKSGLQVRHFSSGKGVIMLLTSRLLLMLQKWLGMHSEHLQIQRIHPTTVKYYYYFNFYCSIIDSQYCVTFCCTAQWVSYTYESESESFSHSVMYHCLQPSRFLYPWNSLGKNTGVGCHSLLQEIEPWDQTRVSHTTGRFFTIWATNNVRGFPFLHILSSICCLLTF